MIKHWLVVEILVAVILAGGCAKRPAMTQASAPAPTGAATASNSASSVVVAPAPGRASDQSGPSSGSSVTRSTTSEFAPAPALRDIHFDFDKSAIRPGDARVLDTNGGWLKEHPNQLVLIEGHCDERGTVEYNLALGERRARATQNYLVSQGIAASRITVVSYGEERPVCTEHTEACWAKNRRAHFLTKRS